jgi:hypothetical protein
MISSAIPIHQLRPNRVVQSSATHKAYWFDVSLNQLKVHFGERNIQSLINQLGNGVSSASNQSSRAAQNQRDMAIVEYQGEWDGSAKEVLCSYVVHLPDDGFGAAL